MGLWDNAAFGTTSPAETADKSPNLWDKLLSGVTDQLYSLPQRAIQNSQYSLNTGNYDPGPTLEAATLPMGTGAIAGVPVKAGEAVIGAGPIRAYHGSPHDFDAFSMDKIGTGEGAQAYGHGLYFAENEGTAKSYRDALKQWNVDGAPADPANPAHIASATLEHFGGDRAKAIEDLTHTTKIGPQSERDVSSQAIEMLRSGTELPAASGHGRMYEVNINADPEHFLDWDKPLNKQHPIVQEAINNISPDVAARVAREKYSPGKQISDIIANERLPLGQATDANISAAMRDAGIPGIKYLDQGSRGVPTVNGRVQSAGPGKFNIVDDFGVQAGPFPTLEEANQYLGTPKQTSNYVVFDPKMIDIMRKYGIGGATPFLAGLGLTGQDNSQ